MVSTHMPWIRLRIRLAVQVERRSPLLLPLRPFATFMRLDSSHRLHKSILVVFKFIKHGLA